MNITGSSDFDLLQNGVPLPLGLFTVIGELLIGESKFASLANLNETNSLIREPINAVLWTTVTLDAITPGWNATLEKARDANASQSWFDVETSIAEIQKRSTRFKAESNAVPTDCKYLK